MVRSNRRRGRTEHEEGGAAAAGTPAAGGVARMGITVDGFACRHCGLRKANIDEFRDHPCGRVDVVIRPVERPMTVDWHERETAIARD